MESGRTVSEQLDFVRSLGSCRRLEWPEMKRKAEVQCLGCYRRLPGETSLERHQNQTGCVGQVHPTQWPTPCPDRDAPAHRAQPPENDTAHGAEASPPHDTAAGEGLISRAVVLSATAVQAAQE